MHIRRVRLEATVWIRVEGWGIPGGLEDVGRVVGYVVQGVVHVDHLCRGMQASG